MSFKLVILASMIALVACLPTDPYATKDPYSEEPNIVDYNEKKEAYSEKKAYSVKKSEYKSDPSYKPEYKKPEIKAYRSDTSYTATEKYAEKATEYVDKSVKSQATVSTTTVETQQPAILPVPVPVVINAFDPFNPLTSLYNPYAPFFNPYGYIQQYYQINDISPLNPANPLSIVNPDSPYYNGAFAAFYYKSTTTPLPVDPLTGVPLHPVTSPYPAVPVTPPVRHYY